MSSKSFYFIEPLASHHDRTLFSSGNALLDTYLHQQVGQDQRRFATVAYVLLANDSQRIWGYYTLSALSIDLGDLPDGLAKRLPRYPSVPVTMLGRLAVDISVQKSGFGEFLLLDALNKCLTGADRIGSTGVIVDAIDDNARQFYLHFGFTSLKDRPDRLYLPTKTIAALFSQK
ncbi:MAG: GNAT family N-acetyltransferase [Myxococcota bacterium]|nr:GNAT family N-acetyltransferase [Myxococcota bacterium]